MMLKMLPALTKTRAGKTPALGKTTPLPCQTIKRKPFTQHAKGCLILEHQSVLGEDTKEMGELSICCTAARGFFDASVATVVGNRVGLQTHLA